MSNELIEKVKKGLDEIVHRWSAQDLITLDKLPYNGELTSGQPNILIATDFRKWGMSNGTAAALLFRDMVLGKENVVGQLIKGKLDSPRTNPEDLAVGFNRRQTSCERLPNRIIS